MSKVTSKLQVTVPKALAERYGIRPGDDIRFEEAGEVIRVVPAAAGEATGGLDTDRAPPSLRRGDRPPADARGGANGTRGSHTRLDQRGTLRAWPHAH